MFPVTVDVFVKSDLDAVSNVDVIASVSDNSTVVVDDRVTDRGLVHEKKVLVWVTESCETVLLRVISRDVEGVGVIDSEKVGDCVGEALGDLVGPEGVPRVADAETASVTVSVFDLAITDGLREAVAFGDRDTDRLVNSTDSVPVL